MIYLLIANGESKSISVIAISLCFAVPSIISSTMTILYNPTSNLTQDDYHKLLKRNDIEVNPKYIGMMASLEPPPIEAEKDVSAIPFRNDLYIDRSNEESKHEDNDSAQNYWNFHLQPFNSNSKRLSSESYSSIFERDKDSESKNSAR